MSTEPANRNEVHPVKEFVPATYPQGIPRHLNIPTMPAWGLLERASNSIPENVANVFMGHTTTYSQMNDSAERLAVWLQTRGIEAGDRVAVLLPNCPEYPIALNGIWRAGAVAVAVSPLSVSADVERLLKFTDCKAIITLDLLSGLVPTSDKLMHLIVSLRPYLPGWKRAGYLAALWHRTGRITFPRTDKQTWFWSAIEEADKTLVPVPVDVANDPAYILSTGGTTGDPKAVTLSHRNIVSNAWQQKVWAGDTMGQEKMLAVLPFFHCYGMSTMLAGGTALGATLIMQPRFNVKQVLAGIEEHRPTVFHAVPAMLSAMNSQLRSKLADLSSIKWVISGGASLPKAVAEEFADFSGALVVEGYGLSEASPVTHVGPLDGSNETGTIGLPLPETECRIVAMDSAEDDLSVGEVGELLVRGPQVMLGYWKNSEATAETIRDGWLYTGDLALRTERGSFRIVDRKKDLIITSGFNVYPADVERVLRDCEEVQDVAVIGEPDEKRGEVVKAFVVMKNGCHWNQKRLEQFCKTNLAAHRRPRQWEHVKVDLPRNFLGKVVRRQLKQLNLEVSE